jgi:hypothetical protein
LVAWGLNGCCGKRIRVRISPLVVRIHHMLALERALVAPAVGDLHRDEGCDGRPLIFGLRTIQASLWDDCGIQS